MNGSLISNLTGVSASIVTIQWGAGGGVGPVALDSSGIITEWNDNGQKSNQFMSNSTPSGFTMVQSMNQTYAALNFGTYAQEYIYNSSSGTTTKTKVYNPLANTTFSQIMYTPNYQELMVATNTSNVQIYNCSNGQNSGYYFSTNSMVQMLSHYTSNMGTLLTQQNEIFIYTNSSYSNLGKFYIIIQDQHHKTQHKLSVAPQDGSSPHKPTPPP